MKLINIFFLTSSLLLAAVTSAHCDELKVFAAHYYPDTPFPEFRNLWHEGFALAQGQEYTPDTDAAGGYIFVHLQNLGTAAVTIVDVTVEGIKLSEGLGRTNDANGELYGHSVAVSKIPDSAKQKLRDAGEPVWWKAEPRIVPPKGLGQIVIRLRRPPKIETVKIQILAQSSNVSCSVPMFAWKHNPRFSGVYFTPQLDTIYAYITRPRGAVKPNRIFLDGKDITALSIIGVDPGTDTIPVVIRLPKQLDLMSYHCLRVTFPDATTATTGIRAWGHELVYGIWGSGSDPYTAYKDWAAHNFNVRMGHGDKRTMELSLDPSGFEFLKSLGFRNMATWFGNARNPIFYFLLDEPDAQDYGIDDLPPNERLGLLGQALVEKADELRRLDPKTPILLNVDATYKPENWFTYHQLADIPCIDPYYQGELDMVYTKRPGRYQAFTKPTYVYAATTISQSACQPKPLHVILCSTRYNNEISKGDYKGRYPTPEEKRLEVYYAIGAGAKGISYWWFTASGECYGMGSDEPEAKALYKEVGLLGAELRTAGPVITLSQPIKLDIKTPRLVSARCLARGTDALVLVVTNDNVLCDRLGTVYKPAEKVNVTLQAPTWLDVVDAFEIRFDGTRGVTWKRQGRSVELELGTLQLTKLVILTSDRHLRQALQALYDKKFAAHVQALKSGASAN
ncbi:MAG: hypothetical protein QHI38_09935 [Armatimonadota bacterium]|nr:hypothetical protein [Armatimonadota bacterium]